MNPLKKFCLATALVTTLGVTACNSNENAQDNLSGDGATRPLTIFNAKGENAVEFENLAIAYQEETGIEVNVFSVGMGEDHTTPLSTEMTSSSPPHIFTIQGVKELADWTDGGFILDLATIDNHPEFQALVNDIPQELRLTTNGVNNYGVPYNIEGYGYIVDKQMLDDLFEDVDVEVLLEDIRLATYEEWEVLVTTIDTYIENPSSATVSLNNTEYTLRAEKTGVAENLTGVFASMGAESWTYGDHFVNVALNAVYANASDAYQATSEELENLHDALVMYAKALDFKTSHLAGANGPVQRSFDFVSPANFGYDQTVQIFADSKAVFLKQGNWAEGNIRNTNPEVADRLTFLPVKMPVTEEMIMVDGLTVEHFNSSIPTFVPMYYSINATLPEEEQLMAMDFLLWLNTSETGQDFIVNEFAFIPYTLDIENTPSIGYPLGDALISYTQKDAILGAPWMGSPGPWGSDIYGNGIMERYMIKAEWTEEDYNDIAEFGISSWQRLLS